MSASDNHIKESIKNTTLSKLFDFNKCPPKFRRIFQDTFAFNSLILTMKKYSITDDEVQYIVAFLNVCPSVQSLDISCNKKIGLKGIQALASITTVKRLNISQNRIDLMELTLALMSNTFLFKACPPKFFNIFKDTLAERSESLNLSQQGITSEEVPYIITFLKLCQSVKTLDVSYNSICPKGAQILANNGTFNTLYISGNFIYPAGLMYLAGNTSLKTLEASTSYSGHHAFNDVSDTDVMRALADSTTLINLKLSSFAADQYIGILANNTTLETLDLSDCGNAIDERCAMPFICNTTLQELNLSKNEFSDYVAKTLSYFALNKDLAFKFQVMIQAMTFMMGFHKRVGAESFISQFLRDPIYDRKVLKELFGFIGPISFNFLNGSIWWTIHGKIQQQINMHKIPDMPRITSLFDRPSKVEPKIETENKQEQELMFTLPSFDEPEIMRERKELEDDEIPRIVLLQSLMEALDFQNYPGSNESHGIAPVIFSVCENSSTLISSFDTNLPNMSIPDNNVAVLQKIHVLSVIKPVKSEENHYLKCGFCGY